MGSGVGFYLHRLDDLGFTDLRGIDPFLKEETIRSGRIVIYRKFLEEFGEKDFELITLHHVFEHLPNPEETLNAIYSKLRPGGYCVIRVPVIPNVAWDEYREHWFQLDAPRHIFIPSADTMAFLRRQTSFEIVGTIYDSTPKQFYISEGYRQGIPMSKQPHHINPGKMADYEKRTAIANKMGRGDQAIFILRKPAN
jgi:SAM-dependent methyltransferase